MVKPSLPAPFTGRMDEVFVSRFVHQLDNYFRIVEWTDDALKRAKLLLLLLEGTAYKWFTV